MPADAPGPQPVTAPGALAEDRGLNVPLASASVFLSVAALAWMAGGLFRGDLGRVAAMVGAVIGVGLIAVSYRVRRPLVVQYMVLPVAMIAGAVFLFAGSHGSSLGDLPHLVSQAVRTGGLGQPPVAFDPGWRLIVVVLTAVVGAAAASLTLGLNRMYLGVFLPLPAMFAAALIQPKAGSVAAGTVAAVLFVGALAVSYGAELARGGATSADFELRRLGRAGAIMAVLTVALVLLSRASFLFPQPARSSVTPPKKPQANSLQSDRVLFTVRSDQPGPWRMGVLDVYDGNAWRLPPVDRRRLKDVPDDGRLPGAVEQAPKSTATFQMVDIQGHEIPDLANPQVSKGSNVTLSYDPRTQLLQLPDRSASQGTTYTVEAPAAPDPAQLAQAPPAPAALKQFTDAPPPPPGVAGLLSRAPSTTPGERLKFVRDALEQSVVTAKAGNPIDVPPARVDEMLAGHEATPYEITAAEVLLARWAGVPARFGYGYFGGERKGDLLEVHPRQGATWLEAYFEGYGWIPITSVPPKAKGSFSQGEKQSNSTVNPSDDITLTLYVPIKLKTILFPYKVVRYWVLVTLPWVIALLLLWRFYPGVLKAARRLRRRQWAEKAGLGERVGVAYAELRDASTDLNLGGARRTPLEFAASIEPDDELVELTWLCTRALWGDLRRDLRPADAETAEALARSVTRRLRRAQSATTRILAVSSRASLREPYTYEIPNLWRTRRAAAAGSRQPRRQLFRRVVPVGAAVAVMAMVLVACGTRQSPHRAARPAIPERLVPEKVGDFAIQRESSAEKRLANASTASLLADGRVFTVRRPGAVLGYLQIGAFKSGFGADRTEVRRGILDKLASGRFQPVRRGEERIYVTRLRDQTYQVWFPPGGRLLELFVARRSFADAESVFSAIRAFQRSGVVTSNLRPGPTPPDPRRGEDDL